MATDATGTPTSPDSIPTYNVNVDDPSGNGFNAAMAAIQTALSKRPGPTITSLATNDVPVWNGSTWVRPTGTGSSTTFLRGDGTWSTPTTATELDYSQITANVTVSGTSGAQTTVITGNSVAYDGATTILLEVSIPGVANGSADNVTVELWDGATSIGVIGQISTGGAASVIQVPLRHAKRFVPTAASHTYTVKAYRGTVNGTIIAGTGAAGALTPAFLRITKAA